MKIPKLTLVLIGFIIVGVLSIMLYKSCNNTTDTDNSILRKENQRLRDKRHSDSATQEALYKQDSSLIHNLTVDLDTTKKALAEVRQKFDARGRQILATNKDLHAALIIHDTPAVYKNAEYISFQIDSIAQVKWNVDRELDRQTVLNEQLRIADSTALANCRGDLKNTRSAASELAGNYEAQHQQDAIALKKVKKRRWLDRIIGGGIAEGIRGIVSIFKK